MKKRANIGVGLAKLAAVAAGGALLLAATPALAQEHGHHGGGGFGGPPGGFGRGGFGHGGFDRGGPPGGGWAHAGPPGRAQGREGMSREGSAPGGGPSGWDERRFNGYWAGGRWYYGAPNAATPPGPDFRPGFTPWRRGSFLPPNYQAYVLDDYARYHLRRPPYGYHWVQVGGEYLLVSASTGLIFDVVTGF